MNPCSPLLTGMPVLILDVEPDVGHLRHWMSNRLLAVHWSRRGIVAKSSMMEERWGHCKRRLQVKDGVRIEFRLPRRLTSAAIEPATGVPFYRS